MLLRKDLSEAYPASTTQRRRRPKDIKNLTYLKLVHSHSEQTRSRCSSGVDLSPELLYANVLLVFLMLFLHLGRRGYFEDAHACDVHS